MEEGKIVYDWAGIESSSLGDTTGDETSSVGEAELMRDPLKGILRTPTKPPPAMPSALAFGKGKEKETKAVSFEEEETISTTNASLPQAKRGRGRPKKNAPLTSSELKAPLTSFQAEQVQRKIDNLDKRREAQAQEEKKKAVQEEIARRAKIEAEGTAEVSEALGRLNDMYLLWPQYRESCPRKTPYGPKTPVEEILKEINRIQEDMNGNRAYNTICSYHVMLMGGIERMGCEAGQPFHGLAERAMRSRDIVENELKEMSIKYKKYLSGGGPELRYLQAMAYLAYCVRAENIQILKRQAMQGMSEQARQEFEQKYGEL